MRIIRDHVEATTSLTRGAWLPRNLMRLYEAGGDQGLRTAQEYGVSDIVSMLNPKVGIVRPAQSRMSLSHD